MLLSQKQYPCYCGHIENMQHGAKSQVPVTVNGVNFSYMGMAWIVSLGSCLWEIIFIALIEEGVSVQCEWSYSLAWSLR